MNKYLMAFTSDSHHLMFESPFYFKIYEVEANSLSDTENLIDYYSRLFSLEFKVMLKDVYHLWSCKIK